VGVFALLAVTVGCLPDEDTSPSTALFPSTHYGDVRPDFTGLVASHADREAVELYALFGAQSGDIDQKTLKPIQEALGQQGSCENSANGRKVYRTQTMIQAQQLLQTAWPQEKWTPESDLAKRFAMAAHSTVAMFAQTDQRILFFDSANRLVEVYPKVD
jgi:hypothetical protein